MKTIMRTLIGAGTLGLMGLLTGCILPGHHGGKHGLPLPGHHGSHQADPAPNFVAPPPVNPGGHNSPQLVQNQNIQTPREIFP